MKVIEYLWTITNGVDAIGPVVIGLILIQVARKQPSLDPLKFLAVFLFSVALEIFCADVRGQFYSNQTFLSLSVDVFGRVQEIVVAVATIMKLMQFFFRQKTA